VGTSTVYAKGRRPRRRGHDRDGWTGLLLDHVLRVHHRDARCGVGGGARRVPPPDHRVEPPCADVVIAAVAVGRAGFRATPRQCRGPGSPSAEIRRFGAQRAFDERRRGRQPT